MFPAHRLKISIKILRPVPAIWHQKTTAGRLLHSAYGLYARAMVYELHRMFNPYILYWKKQ